MPYLRRFGSVYGSLFLFLGNGILNIGFPAYRHRQGYGIKITISHQADDAVPFPVTLRLFSLSPHQELSMEFSGWLGFLSASIFLAFVPGPDNIFVLLQSATNGFRSGFFVILGLCTGLVFQTLCATLGLAAVVAASTWLFGAICVLGALYLLYLAWGAWHAPIVAEPTARVSSLAPQAAWRRGTLMNITNPKVQIFFLAFFPQFLFEGAGTAPVWVQMLIMGITFIAATLLVFTLIAFFAGALSLRLKKPMWQRVLNKGSAVIFVLLALSALYQIVSHQTGA